MSLERISIGCGIAALAAYASALRALLKGYPHALDNACPDGAPAPAAFWPLLLGALGLAVATFVLRPAKRDEHGARSAANVFALLVVIGVPIAALLTALGYEVTYACWE